MDESELMGEAGPLEGKAALVTGGAGGIGFATARRLGEEGAHVVIADRDAERLAASRDELALAGLDVVAIVFDQSEPEEVRTLFERIGQLDICFANAGYGRFASILEQDLKTWRRHIDVNLTGTFLVCQGAARAMVAGGSGGAIVVNASTSALHSAALFGAYSASKAGVEMLAKTMAEELGPDGIRVNVICPGTIESGMTTAMLDQDGGGMREIYEGETPLGRVGKAEEVAALVSFLSGDDSGYITGATVVIDGGQTLRGLPRWFVRRPDEDDFSLLSELRETR